MADFWENDQLIQPKEEQGFWHNDTVVSQKAKSSPYSVLPVSEDEKGNPHLDFNAGIFGPVKRAYDYFSKTVSGQEPFDPTSPEAIKSSMNIAMASSPVSAASKYAQAGVTAIPSKKQLFETAGKQFDKVRDSGVDYSSNAVQQAAGGWQRALEGEGFLESDAPKTHLLLNNLQSPPPDSVMPISGMMSMRRSLLRKTQDFTNPSEQGAAGRVLSSLDEYLANPPSGSVVRGPADEVSSLYKEARGNYAAGKRSETIESKDYRGNLNADTANSGMNVDNAIRQQAKSLLLDKKALSGFSPEEIAAIDEVARGSTSRNAIRFVGNILGGGGGIGSLIAGSAGAGAGTMLAGPTGAALGASAVPLTGMAAKRFGGYLSQKALNNVDTMVRQRSPLFRQMQQQAPVQQINPQLRSIPLRGLLYGLQPNET